MLIRWGKEWKKEQVGNKVCKKKCIISQLV